MKPIKPNLIAKINRLDQALRIWEDKMERLYMQQMLTKNFLPNKEQTYFLSTHACQHWKSLRNILLHSLSGKDGESEIKKFADGALYSSETNDGLFGDFVFPEMIFNWTKHSRRIFQVNDELATNLAATSFGDALLGDIKLPFDAFAVSLDTPVLIPTSGDKVDFILLARADITTGLLLGGKMSKIPNTKQAMDVMESALGKNPYYLMFFQSGMEKYEKHDEKLKARILQKLKEGDYTHLELLANSLKDKDTVYRYAAAGFISVADPDCGEKSLVPLSELLKDDEIRNAYTGGLDTFPDFTKIIRIVYGLAMYLTQSTASDVVSIARPPIPEKKRNGYNLVTDPAEVLRVAFVTDRKQEDKDILTQNLGGYELGPHFREGYWRRFPGQGKFDVAELVWVPPVIVRKDKLPDGSLPNAVAMTV